VCVYLHSQLDHFDCRLWADVLTRQVSIEWFRECIINDNVLALQGKWGYWLRHHCKKNDIHRQLHIWYWITTSFSCHRQPLVGHYPSFVITPKTPQSVGPLWTSGRPDAETSSWKQGRNTHVSGGIRTRSPSSPAAADPWLTPREHWDQQNCIWHNKIKEGGAGGGNHLIRKHRYRALIFESSLIFF
jgi:hypothetical protein